MRECFIIDELGSITHPEMKKILEKKGLLPNKLSLSRAYQNSLEEFNECLNSLRELGLFTAVLDYFDTHGDIFITHSSHGSFYGTKEGFKRYYLSGLLDSPFFRSGLAFSWPFYFLPILDNAPSWLGAITDYLVLPPFHFTGSENVVYPDLLFGFLYLILREEVEKADNPRTAVFKLFKRSGKFKKWLDYLGYVLWLRSTQTKLTICLYDEYTFDWLWKDYEPKFKDIFSFVDEDFKEGFKELLKKFQLNLLDLFDFPDDMFICYIHTEYDTIPDLGYVKKLGKRNKLNFRLVHKDMGHLDFYDVCIDINLEKVLCLMRQSFGFYPSDEEMFSFLSEFHKGIVLMDRVIRGIAKVIREKQSFTCLVRLQGEVDDEIKGVVKQIGEMLEVLLDGYGVEFFVKSPLDKISSVV